MAPKQKQSINTSRLLASLREKTDLSEKSLREHHPRAVALMESVGLPPGKIREHAAKIATTGALTGSLLLSSPAAVHVPLIAAAQYGLSNTQELQNSLSEKLATILPQQVGPLTPDQETKISQALKDIWDLPASAELENERLNQSYGLMGLEQHLSRFPGDIINRHVQYREAGMALGRGAWGYFAPDGLLTPDLEEKEKYYVAVQTLYLPDWNTRQPYLQQWYKYRKVVVINPLNGKTIICDIADSGPANWTGKQFGGSPEVMTYLDLAQGPQKGPVILFFINDPQNKIPLGPLKDQV